MNYLRYILLILALAFASSCNDSELTLEAKPEFSSEANGGSGGSQGNGNNNGSEESGEYKAVVYKVSIVNNQLVLDGNNLEPTTRVQLNGDSYVIESKTNTKIIANGLANLSYIANQTLNLLIGTADASATFTVSFIVEDGSITASKIADMGAQTGQVLQFNGTSWAPADLSGLAYAGTWNADTNTPDLTLPANQFANEFFIVRVAGNTDLGGGAGTNDWSVGDWAIYNGISNQWEKVEKQVGPLDDLSNVDTTGATNGQVLKFDGTNWTAQNESGGGGGLPTTGGTMTGDIVFSGTQTFDGVDVSAVDSQVTTNTTAIANRLPLAGGTMTGDVIFNGTQTFDGVDVSALDSQVTSNTTNIANRLPLNGGIMTGNISFSGTQTVDGVDVSALNGQVTTNQTDITNRLPLAGGTMTGDITFSGTQTFDGVDVSALSTQVTTNASNIGNGLQLSGGTMTGDITFSGTQTFDGVDVSTLNSQVSTNATNITNRLPLAGGTMTGDITFSGTQTFDGVDVSTLNSQVGTNSTNIGNRLPLAGGTMTGDITFSGTQTFDGVDVSALDSQVSTNSGTITTNATNISNRLPLIGGTMLGDITFSASQTFDGVDVSALNTQVSTNTTNVTNALQTTGDNMTGPLGLGDNLLSGVSALRINDGVADNYVEIVVPNDNTANYTLTLPADDGDLNQVLTTDGNGVLTWTTPAGGGSNLPLAGGTMTGDITFNGTQTFDGVDVSALDGSVTTNTGNISTNTGNISTNTTDIAARLPLAGGTMTGTLNMGANNITTSGTVDGVDVSALATTVAGKENTISAGTTAQYYRGDKSFQTLDTDAVAEGSNEYHTTARARSAAVVNSTAGSETDQAASVAAMKSYVTANAGTGDFLKDGSVAMTGDLNLNSNALTNGTSGTFSGNLTAGVLRPADTASDTNFWELQEDGSNRFLFNYNSSQQALITTDGKLHITEICDEAGANCKDASGAWSTSAGTVTSVSGGAGLSDGPITTTGSLSVNVDNSTIEINTDALRLKDGGITNAKINATAAIAYSKLNIADGDLTIAKTSGLQTVLDAKALASRSIAAGDGLTGGGDLSADRTLAVNVDDSTIEINTDTLRVKDSGITNAKINSVADSKITTSCSDNQVLKASSGSFVCAEDTSGSPTLETKTTDYTVTTSDNNKILLVSGETTLTLPAAASAGSGFSLTVKKTDSSNKVTIDGDSTETIDGEEERSLETQYAFTKIVSDGSNWFIVAQNGTIESGTLSCPTGFIAVTGNGTLGTSDFCVMQFEARNVSSTPRSNDADASSSPWVSINATTAQSTCEAMTEGGFSGTFTLISNPEWMTIARDIEGVASNWSGASVGSGHIPRGHSDNSPSSGALAITSTADSYDGTGNNSGQAAGSGWEQKRTHTLSNGSTIWDFSGNVWEWVDWDSGSAGFTTGPTNASSTWRALTSLAGSVTANDLQSSGGYAYSQSFGQWYGGSGGAARRGGGWNNGTLAGAFALSLNDSSSAAAAYIGFRCVYRP